MHNKPLEMKFDEKYTCLKYYAKEHVQKFKKLGIVLDMHF